MNNIGIKILITNVCLMLAFLPTACADHEKNNSSKSTSRSIQKIVGKEDPIPKDSAQKGRVLIAYSDCYTCHKEEEKSVGPSFQSIAKKYPFNKVYTQMLAQKIMVGGSGNWGSPVMSPHPDLSYNDAKLMVSYILSLDN